MPTDSSAPTPVRPYFDTEHLRARRVDRRYKPVLLMVPGVGYYLTAWGWAYRRLRFDLLSKSRYRSVMGLRRPNRLCCRPMGRGVIRGGTSMNALPLRDLPWVVT